MENQGPTVGQKHRDRGRVTTPDELSWWPEDIELEDHICEEKTVLSISAGLPVVGTCRGPFTTRLLASPCMRGTRDLRCHSNSKLWSWASD